MRKLIYILIITILILPLSMQAAEPELYTLLEPLPCLDGVDTGCTPGNLQEKIDISSYILYVYNLAFAASVFLAIVMIIWGGFEYITSEIPFIKSDGKSKIEKAITGLVMVLASYLILQTIDPRLVNVNTELPALKVNKANIEAYKNSQSDLAKKIQATSAEEQLKVSNNNGDIASLVKEKNDIQGKINRGEISAEDGLAQIASINSRISSKTVDNLILTADAVGSQTYASAIRKMSGTSSTYPPTYIDQEIKILEAQYNALITQISSTNNTSSDKISKLISQRTFYTNQMKDDLLLHNLVNSSTNKQTLSAKLEAYKKDLNDSAKISASGVSQTKYQEIYSSKIQTVESLINLQK